MSTPQTPGNSANRGPAGPNNPSAEVRAAGMKSPSAPGGRVADSPLYQPGQPPQDAKGNHPGSMVTGCRTGGEVAFTR